MDLPNSCIDDFKSRDFDDADITAACIHAYLIKKESNYFASTTTKLGYR